MKTTIYISGSITDPQTNQPRDGWQKDFLEAEAQLRAKGFNVINPIDIAQEVEDCFMWRSFKHFSGPQRFGKPSSPTRTDYIMACLQRMKMAHDADMLHGVYVIGKDTEPLDSIGVNMELHMATLLGIPIYYKDLEHAIYLKKTQYADITELFKE